MKIEQRDDLYMIARDLHFKTVFELISETTSILLQFSSN